MKLPQNFQNLSWSCWDISLVSSRWRVRASPNTGRWILWRGGWCQKRLQLKQEEFKAVCWNDRRRQTPLSLPLFCSPFCFSLFWSNYCCFCLHRPPVPFLVSMFHVICSFQKFSVLLLHFSIAHITIANWRSGLRGLITHMHIQKKCFWQHSSFNSVLLTC